MREIDECCDLDCESYYAIISSCEKNATSKSFINHIMCQSQQNFHLSHPVVRVGVGSGKASFVRWPQKYLTASLRRSRAEKRAAIVTSAVVPNDGFPVGAFVVVVVSVVRAAKTSGGSSS